MLKSDIEKFFINNPNIEIYLDYEDSSKKYPSLINTEYEFYLYKRWEIKINNITHKDRELLVEHFEKKPININGFPLIFYSES